MARQRSGSGSARQSKGPRGARPGAPKSGSRKPTTAGRAAAAEPPATVEEPPPAVEDTATAEPPAADTLDAEAAATGSRMPSVGRLPTVGAGPSLHKPDPAADDVDDAVETTADETVDEDVELDADAEPYEDVDVEEEPAAAFRSPDSEALWANARIAPVEIALPKGVVGFTLRAYRMSDELAPVEVEERADEFAASRLASADDRLELTDDDEAFAGAVRMRADRRDDPDAIDDADESTELEAEDVEEASDAEAESETEEDEEESTAPVVEEVPVFLARRGTLYLFGTAEGLVDFVRSDAEHDLLQLDTWEMLREEITPADVVPLDEDRYELDLVVENLRGGADALDAGLVIRAGEVARDLAYALRLQPLIDALAPGSPLDDLDETLRTAENGGIRGFLAKRRLRKIVTQQAALGWRTMIGKISAVVDWRN